MSNQPHPKTIQDADGNDYTAFINPHMPGRVFIEMTRDEAKTSGVEGKQYRGRTTGGEPIGVTGGESMIYAPTVCVTVFIDVSDNGWTVTEYHE